MPPWPEVIVVGTDDHGLVRQRARAFEHADHVLRLDRRAFDVDADVTRPAVQLARARLQVGIDCRFEVGERRKS